MEKFCEGDASTDRCLGMLQLPLVNPGKVEVLANICAWSKNPKKHLGKRTLRVLLPDWRSQQPLDAELPDMNFENSRLRVP